jgi:hypothetical protein
MTTLDVPEPQVLIYFEGDANFQWHHRVALRRLKDSTWILLTPDLEIQVTDLGAVRIIALAKNSSVPADVMGNCYMFDALSEDELVEHHMAAARMSEVLGACSPTVASKETGKTQWLQADTGSAGFATQVADEVMVNSNSGVVRGSVGLALMSGVWELVEKVLVKDLDVWMSDKRSGAGRDPRIAGDKRDVRGRRWMGLSEAIDCQKPIDLTKELHWALSGPRSSMEVLTAVRSTGLELNTYHDKWQAKSGIHVESAICWEHKILFMALALLINFDQVDVSNLAGAEFMCRRILMIQKAVKMNPKCPAFGGLHRMIENNLDESGGLMTVEYTEHIAKLAEAEAKVLKSQRLYREEARSAKKEALVDDAGEPKGKGKKKKDKKEE